jgi:hypothetical protein
VTGGAVTGGCVVAGKVTGIVVEGTVSGGTVVGGVVTGALVVGGSVTGETVVVGAELLPVEPQAAASTTRLPSSDTAAMARCHVLPLFFTCCPFDFRTLENSPTRTGHPAGKPR